jgi:hypothetical protein
MGAVFTICSDVPPYTWWKDKPCLQARDEWEFLEHVKWAVANITEARAMGRAARELVLAERTAAKQADLWREALATH